MVLEVAVTGSSREDCCPEGGGTHAVFREGLNCGESWTKRLRVGAGRFILTQRLLLDQMESALVLREDQRAEHYG